MTPNGSLGSVDAQGLRPLCTMLLFKPHAVNLMERESSLQMGHGFSSPESSFLPALKGKSNVS